MTRWILAVGLFLCGCQTTDHLVGLGHSDPPPSVNGAFDGSYYGRARDIGKTSQPALCPINRLGVAEIGDKRLSFAYAPDIIFNPPVQPDGTLHDQVGVAILDGTVTLDHLRMTITTPDCATRYDLKLIGNRS